MPAPNATSLRTSGGKNRGRQQISQQVTKLQEEITSRYRELDEFEAEMRAMADPQGNDATAINIRNWKANMLRQAVQRRMDLQKLDKLILAVNDPANRNCTIAFDPDPPPPATSGEPQREPVTVNCRNREPETFFCYNKPYTAGRPQVYWAPDILDQ